jgi:nucleoside diphosphate kinase
MPGGVSRHSLTDLLTHSLVGEIIARFEKRGFKLVALQMMSPGKVSERMRGEEGSCSGHGRAEGEGRAAARKRGEKGPCSGHEREEGKRGASGRARASNAASRVHFSNFSSHPQEHLEKHYEDLKDKPFFPKLIKYSASRPVASATPRYTFRARADSAVASGPVVGMVWEGLNACKVGRDMLGATNPQASAPGA